MNFGKRIHYSGVSRSLDFRRIEALPRRQWKDAEDLQELVELLTDTLRRPEGCMSLWPIQAAAIREAHDVQGLFGPIAVGQGKALISLLLPTVLEAKTPLLLVPAALRNQTLDHVIPQMRKHWRLHKSLKVLGYEALSLSKNATLIQDISPDLIIADECHYLRNTKAGRTRRVARYMADYPATRFVALSGTITKRSIRDYWHLILWALKETLSPLPLRWREVVSWADALDEAVPEENRVPPGALKRFCDPGENARQGYQRRLRETPGVIASGESDLGVSLRIQALKPGIPGEIREHLKNLEKNWELPNGDEITEAVDAWRHARELLAGFYYKWKVEPPQGWLAARKAWKRWVRWKLRYNRSGLDTELQVTNWARKQPAPPGEWLMWAGIKDTFKPETVPVWVSDYLIHECAVFMHQHTGIVWVEHRAFGERLAAYSGQPYYGAGDSRILNSRISNAASIRAHGTGKNLQQFNHALVASCPTAGDTWEQLLGRLHRPGQEADEVVFDVFLHHDYLRAGFDQALADARYLEDTTGNRQKLNYASVVR